MKPPLLNLPDGYRPEEVAEIRDGLVQDLHGSMALMLDDWNRISESLGRAAPTKAEVELQGFESARLFWVPPEETTAIVEGAQDLPDNLVLTEDAFPSVSGFVVFGADWYGIDALTGLRAKFPIRAMRWGPVNLTWEGHADAAIAISSYTTSSSMNRILATMEPDEIRQVIVNMGLTPSDDMVADIIAGEVAYMREYKPGQRGPWTPLGRSDWTMGESWREHPFGKDHSSYTSIIEDRQIMSALWALMESCPPHEIAPSRAERRRAERRGGNAAPVRVVTWRGPRGERVASTDTVEGRHMTKRFIVKTHWRHQAYGPGRTLRKWILVPKHWRGPEDGEIADPHDIIHKVVQR